MRRLADATYATCAHSDRADAGGCCELHQFQKGVPSAEAVRLVPCCRGNVGTHLLLLLHVVCTLVAPGPRHEVLSPGV